MNLRLKANVGRFLMLVGLALLVGVAISPQDVRYNFMPGTDFAKYHTYKWVPIEGGSHLNQIVDTQIKQAVDSQLASKGLTKTESDKTDLLSAIRLPSIRRNSGTPTAWVAVSALVAWGAPPVLPSMSGLSFSICMTQRRNS
jgi:Domain of unknown function (DUF4136)